MDDLNRLVIEKLGWEPAPDVGLGVMRNKYTGDLSHKMWLKDYTTDLNACFMDLVPKFKRTRMGLEWFADGTWEIWAEGEFVCNADTPAEAMCRAFLAMEERH